MFRDAYRLRRGVLPANGFYEWRGTARKRPYWMTSDDSLMYFAAIWEAYPVQGQVWLSTAVVTQPAMNQRRPLILDAAGQTPMILTSVVMVGAAALLAMHYLRTAAPGAERSLSR